MKVNHKTIIDTVEFNNGESISVGDDVKYGGTVIAINMGKYVDVVEVIVQDGEEGYGIYFNEMGEEVDADEYLD